MDPLARRPKPIRRRKRKKPLSEEIRGMYRLLSITILLMGFVTGGAHLWVNAAKSTNGYELRELQNLQAQLEYESRQLQHMVLLAQSLENLEDDELLEEMLPAETDETSYLEDSAYAQLSN